MCLTLENQTEPRELGNEGFEANSSPGLTNSKNEAVVWQKVLIVCVGMSFPRGPRLFSLKLVVEESKNLRGPWKKNEFSCFARSREPGVTALVLRESCRLAVVLWCRYFSVSFVLQTSFCDCTQPQHQETTREPLFSNSNKVSDSRDILPILIYLSTNPYVNK